VPRRSELRNQILKAKHAYYHRGEAIMSDAEYDALEDELRLLVPDDPVLALVGSPVPADSMLTKARHAMPMGSQSKVNSEGEFRTWCDKNAAGALHASLKGDGASAAAYYASGRLVQVVSRGDGTVGEDITANALRFKGLPAWVETETGGFTGAVRFEVILTVEDWTRVDPARSKNPRNAGAGIMGRKNGHQADCLTIFAFDLDETSNGASAEFVTETAKAARLKELGFSVIPQLRCETADEAVGYFEHTAKTRDTLPFWIDGVVLKIDDVARQRALGVTSGRPKGQIAWKFDSSGVETVLEGVVVSGGHTGGLYPTAQLRPVEIGGTTVSNASLANYDEIERLDVAIGDSVWVVKANDIIPKIIRVTERPATRQAILAPVACPFCGGAVGRRRTSGWADGVMIECRAPDCPKKSSGKIRRWIASLDILGIGDSVLEAMIDRFGLEDAASLYTLRERTAEMADLVINTEKDIRLGERRAAAILDAIDATRSLTVGQLLGSLGLDHLGKRRVALMMKAAGGGLDRIEDWQSGRLREADFAALAGVPNVGTQMQDGIDAMALVIGRLLAVGVTALPPQLEVRSSSDAAGAPVDAAARMSVCISGKLASGRKKSDYAQPLLAAGMVLVDEVAKGVSYLVLADLDSGSSKAEKARKLGVPVITEEDLLRLLAQPNTAPPAEAAAPAQPIQPPPRKAEVMPAAKNKPEATAQGASRRFEFVDDKSSKFWEIRTTTGGVEVRYGKIGTEGQSLLKPFDDAAAAAKSAEKLVAEKLKGGYVEAGPQGAQAAPAQAAKPVAAAAPVAKAPTGPAKTARVVQAPSPAAAGTKSAPKAPAQVHSGKTLCISGKLPSGRKKADYEAPLRAAGIELVEDVMHGLSFLVLADPVSTSSKAEKARKLGVDVISEVQLGALCEPPVGA